MIDVCLVVIDRPVSGMLYMADVLQLFSYIELTLLKNLKNSFCGKTYSIVNTVHSR